MGREMETTLTTASRKPRVGVRVGIRVEVRVEVRV